MSNILYIGPYREFSSMGNIARNYIKSLLISGHNVCIRPIYNTFKPYPEFDIDNDILELENNFNKKYHTVIQHCYPHQYYLDRRFDRTIGIVSLESFNYKNRFQDHLKIPDQLICPSYFVKNSVLEMVEKDDDIFVISPPVDMEKINSYRSTNINNKSKHTTSFYVIADFINKNNILKILEAFWLTFEDNDNVELVIKTKNKTQEHIDINQVIEYEFGKLNSMISKYGKKPKVIVGETRKESIYYLHNNNDCYIDMSSGKSFGYSVLEALAFENRVMCLQNSAQSEIIVGTDNCYVDSDIVSCKDDAKIYDVYNTSDQHWLMPVIPDFIEKLKVFSLENNDDRTTRIKKTKEKIQEYTMESIAKVWSSHDL